MNKSNFGYQLLTFLVSFSTVVALVFLAFAVSGCGRDSILVVPAKECHAVQAEWGARLECSDGTYADIHNGGNGSNGTDGVNGQDGANGADGQDGLDGQDGTNGADAPLNNTDIVEIVDPCGDALGIYDEIFLRMRDGRLVASFSANASGALTRFTILVAGSYQTTDGSGCNFTVNADNSVTW